MGMAERTAADIIEASRSLVLTTAAAEHAGGTADRPDLCVLAGDRERANCRAERRVGASNDLFVIAKRASA